MILALVLFMDHSGMGQGLIISPGTSFTGTGGNIVLRGNVVNNGSFSNNNNTVIFSGAAQSLGGTSPVLFNNLTVASGSTTTITTTGQLLNGILVSNSTLNANGNITLLSTVTQTALIDGSGIGQVSGNVIMQRYLPSGFGYKYFSSPFQGATVNEFGDDMDLSASFSTFYEYDESRVSAGWVSYTNSAGVLNPMHGYAVNFGSGVAALTADVTGVVNNGNLSRTMYNNNETYTKGFNLVGNPYPSPIDWDAGTGWTKTNIDDALYYFKAGGADQYSGTYSTYINGTSSDGLATNIVPSMQGFFIHVSDGAWPVTGTLGIDNNVRIIDNSHQFIKSDNGSTKSFLRVVANFGDKQDSSDPLVIYFDEKAQNEFDSRLDALKLMNTDRFVPNLYAIASDGYNLSINALPVLEDSLLVVPLGLKTEREGIIAFRVRDSGNLPTGINVYLHDEKTGANQSLNLNNAYTIYLNAGEYNNRFSLKFIQGAIEMNESRQDADLLDIYISKGVMIADIRLLPGDKGTMIISNISGQIVFRKDIYEVGYYDVNPRLKSGIYIVNFISGNVRNVKKIFILNK